MKEREKTDSSRRSNGERRPNVVVFFTDQQRWDTTTLAGKSLPLMPNFDRLAERGTFFENAISCQPVCAPARSCLQTGLYATETGYSATVCRSRRKRSLWRRASPRPDTRPDT